MAQLNAHEPLYLKYRPQSLSELVGQQAVTRTLTNAIENNRLTHAYLFTGPRGTGKTSSARILAKSLNCHASEGPTPTPCGECASCLEIRRGNSPAVFEIDAASNNSVDDARTLIERAPLVAVGSRFKIYIIDECHMLTKEAFNALLRTIEDPPAGVVFILATTEEHKVLPTIVSRCQRLMFRLARMDDLGAHLRSVATKEGIEIEDEALQFIARRSGGGLRDALGLLDQASLLSAPGKPVAVQELLGLLGALHEDVLLSISRSMQQRDGNQLLAAIASLLDEGREPAVIAQELSRHFLNLIKASYLHDPKLVTSEVVLGSAPYIAGVVEQAPQFDRAELAIILESLDRLEQTCRRTSQPAMHLEIGMIAICHRRDFTILNELDSRITALEAGQAEGAQGAAPPPRPMARPLSQAQVAPVPAPAPQSAAPRPPAPAPQATAPAPQATAPAPQATAPILAASPSNAVPASAAQIESNESAPSSQSVESAAPASPLEATAEDEEGADEEYVFNAPEPDDSDDREPPASSYIGSVAVIPDAETAPPAVAAAPVAAAPAPAAHTAGSGDSEMGSGSGEDLDFLWSELLGELQQRNIPTFSMASTHGFPLNINDQVLEIGTTKEVFQKSLEQRTQHLQSAAQAVCRRPIAVRVRLCSPEMVTSTSKQSPREHASPKRDSSPGLESADEGGEQPGTQPSTHNSVTAQLAESSRDGAGAVATRQPAVSSAVSPASSPPNSPINSPINSPAMTPTVDAARNAPAVHQPPGAGQKTAGRQHVPEQIEGATHDSSTIKECYKLFEGPGSRLVQKPNN